MANIIHKGGLPNLFSEIGFTDVKYFETEIGGSAVTISINPPATRLILRNTSSSDDLFLRVDGEEAGTDVGIVPGDNIKVGANGIFTMDFDTLSSVSLVASGTVAVEGILGFKGT